MKYFIIGLLCLAFFNFSFSQKISTKEAKEDLNTLISKFEKIHYNPYFVTPKNSVLEQQKLLTVDWDTDSIQFTQLIEVGMRLTALMSGGHSSLDWQNEKIIPELMKYKFIPFSGKLTSNSENFEITKSNLGGLERNDIVVKINNKNIKEIYTDCMNYYGGIEAFKNESLSTYFPIMLFFNNSISAPYTIELDSGEKLVSEGLSLNDVSGMLQQNLPTTPYEYQLLDGNIGLIRYNQCVDFKAFKKFLKTTFKEIKISGTDKLIIDIRQNGGGNSDLNDELLNYLTTKKYRQSSKRYWKVSAESKMAYNSKIHKKVFGKKFVNDYLKKKSDVIFTSEEYDLVQPKKKKNFFNGKHCFLIGPGTFSSANFLADAIKTYQLSTLIGTATGEATNDFGEQISFQLPNSNCFVYVSSTFDIGANGNDQLVVPVFPDISSRQAQKKAIQFLTNN